MISRRHLLATVVFAVSSVPLALLAQQPPRIPRIGFLGIGSDGPSYFQSVRDGLRELGYAEGRNLYIEDRSRVENYDGLPKAIGELLALNVDVLVVSGATSLGAARKATSTTPIVMISGIDPIALGVATTLAKPGGNVTGISQIAIGLGAKRLELLREVLPGLKSIALLYNPISPAQEKSATEQEITAKQLGLRVHRGEARTAQDINAVVAAARKQASALVVLPSTMLRAHRPLVVGAVTKHRFPAISPESDWADAGLMLSYGTNYAGAYRRAAIYVDKILKGTKPGDLPIEQPTKFELVINMKTAKALGIAIPQSVLVRADKVIE